MLFLNTMHVRTSINAGVGDLQVFVRPTAGVPSKGAACCRHLAGRSSLTLLLDNCQGVWAPAVGVGHGTVCAGGPVQAAKVSRDHRDYFTALTGNVHIGVLTCSLIG